MLTTSRSAESGWGTYTALVLGAGCIRYVCSLHAPPLLPFSTHNWFTELYSSEFQKSMSYLVPVSNCHSVCGVLSPLCVRVRVWRRVLPHYMFEMLYSMTKAFFLFDIKNCSSLSKSTFFDVGISVDRMMRRSRKRKGGEKIKWQRVREQWKKCRRWDGRNWLFEGTFSSLDLLVLTSLLSPFFPLPPSCGH